MSETLPSILLVDDEVRVLESLQRLLEDDFDVFTANSADEAMVVLADEWIQVVISDQRMPGMSGVEFLQEVRGRFPEVIRMIVSGYTDSEDIITAVNEAGIHQYITKPWDPDNLLLTIRNAVKMFQLQRENQQLSTELKMLPTSVEEGLQEIRHRLMNAYDVDYGIIRTPESCMNTVCETIRQVATFDVSVLLMGDSGVGKELSARALHYGSLRSDKPFIAENCAALPDELLESELFGYKKGAFTGAQTNRMGLFEEADGGTIFLDEIGDTTPSFQVKLLRVLQEGEIRPLGSNERKTINVRVIAATNKDLEQEVREGRFREDLYYRLATFKINIPPLAERREDVPLLARALLDSAMQELGKKVKGFSDEALACLQAYHWPGNVRELQNEIKRMLVMAGGDYLEASLLSPQVLRAAPKEDEAELEWLATQEGSLRERLDSLEARIVNEALIRNRWNKSKTAKELGLSRVGLRNKLERYGLEKVETLDAQDEQLQAVIN
ncbi:MAG TPA: sigma-54-dependent Fis family transcriptional regulator [Mariprofundaceae bacterium]|nr:sigma-54-dependent Fis family transcriptional regulator [Mariprofundaceae bacterium]